MPFSLHRAAPLNLLKVVPEDTALLLSPKGTQKSDHACRELNAVNNSAQCWLVAQSLAYCSHNQRDHISLSFCDMFMALVLQLDWMYAEAILLYLAAVLSLSRTIQSSVHFLCHASSVFYS